jgi:hypothetical protein
VAGVKGRSGGHNRRTLADHQLRGTLRPGRHRGLVDPAPVPALPLTWKPTPKDLDALSTAGRAFLADALASHEFNFLAGRLLLDAAWTLDMMAVCQASIAAQGVTVTGPRGAVRPNPMVREHLRHAAWLLRALKALRLDG